MALQTIRSLFQKPSSPSVSFQILSDLHLEISQEYSFEIPVCSKYLILAGDIGRLEDYDKYRDFLQIQTSKFELVFLALGNHEFYETTFNTGLEKAKHLEKEPCMKNRLVLLHQRRYDIPDSNITILGCTLWSRIPQKSADIVHYRISDFQKIKEWSVEQHNNAHDSDLTWLKSEIRARNDEKRTILVVTHHAPSLQRTSSPVHAKNGWRFAFGSDLLSLSWGGVRTWVFGHTHYTTEFRKGGITVVSNQRGYVLPWTTEAVNFDVKRVVWV
ncbi:uncharacterized protein PGRI_056910 [Penicillium griseofulvum]|uniref:Calcineurin-like phosphoesterase domain-containing protein n=1 Tax=Penicillium patulum TaxID=5078 RepID=A0A135LL66_PENPA|nr:uncharacterized protein PGRI_056910 [Penicillium griseofulvum]KXG49723.1 hypothetical protein PGRI_056910 [Penicillium griseofulvum]